MRNRAIFSSFLIFSLLFDSGGMLGLQYLSVALFASVVVSSSSMNRLKFDGLFYEFTSLVLIVYVLFFLGTILNESERYFHYASFMIFLMISYFFTSLWGMDRAKDSYIWASILFVIVYLLVHFLLVFYGSAEQIVSMLDQNIAGRFHKKNFFGYEYFVIYPQSILFITGASVVLFLRGRYFLYLMTLLLLFISTSRFGLLTSLLMPFFCYVFGVRAAARFLTYSFPFLILGLFLCYFLVYFYFREDFNPDYYYGLSSFEARVGQLISTIESFSSVSEVFFGQGAGSEFYSLRSLSYVDNSELSQLEFIRKYGVISFVTFHVLIFRSLYLCNVRKRYEELLIIFTVYFTTLSNPVLTSLFLAMVVVYGYIPRSNRERSNYRKI